jgi:hypothetical protein
MIRTRIAATLLSGLLMVSGLAAADTNVHAAGGTITPGLYFSSGMFNPQDPNPSITEINISTGCQTRTRACLTPVYYAQTFGSRYAVGPLPAQPVPGTQALTFTVPPPCRHAPNTTICDPVLTTTSITITPTNPGVIQTDIITRGLTYYFYARETEFLCLCLPG